MRFKDRFKGYRFYFQMKVVDKCPWCGLDIVYDQEYRERFLCPRCGRHVISLPAGEAVLSIVPVDPSDGLEACELTEGSFTLGRKSLRSRADVQFPVYDGFMSKVHCKINIDGISGHGGITATLSDAGSANGTYLNGRRLSIWETAVISDGDEMQLGNTRFSIKFIN